MTSVPYDLIDAFLDGEMDLAQAQQLQDWLMADATHRQEFLRLTQIHHGLYYHLESETYDIKSVIATFEPSAESSPNGSSIFEQVIDQQIEKQKQINEDSNRQRAIAIEMCENKAKAKAKPQSPDKDEKEKEEKKSGVLLSFAGVNVYRSERTYSLRGRLVAAAVIALAVVIGWQWLVDNGSSKSDTIVTAQENDKDQQPLVVVEDEPQLLDPVVDQSPRVDEIVPGSTVNRPVVAHLTRLAGATWKQSPSDKGELVAGSSWQLVDGFAEIVFDSGARAVLEAPCTFNLTDDNAMTLNRGKLVAQVPPQASGFTVQTPHAMVTDFGTEFGVEASETDETHVVVFKGEVELKESSLIHIEKGELAQSYRMTANQSGRVDATGQLQQKQIVKHQSQADYIRHMPETDYAAAVVRARPLIYWRFASLDNGIVRNEIANEYAAKVVGNVEITEGLVNEAVRFGASGNSQQYLELDKPVKELAGIDSFAVELWIKPVKYHVGTLVHFWTPSRIGEKRPLGQFSIEAINKPKISGEWAVGHARSIRFCYRGFPSTQGGRNLMSDKPYQLNQWQHIVAVKEGKQLRLYINGQLSTESTTNQKFTIAPRVMIGNLAAWVLGGGNDRPLQGQLDEVAIYTRALSQEEVESHYNLIEHK